MYTVKDKRLVCFGSVDKNILKQFKIKDNVFVADFNWDLIIDHIQKNKITYAPVNKFPIVRRDLSLLVDNEITFEKLKKIAKKVDSSLLKDISLFDVFSENHQNYQRNLILFGLGWPLGRHVGLGPPP